MKDLVLLGKRQANEVLTLGGPEFGQAFEAEVIPDVTEEIAAVRLSV
jgi:hypothetical protein